MLRTILMAVFFFFLPFNLLAQKHYFKITASVDSAQVFLNGEFLGYTPHTMNYKFNFKKTPSYAFELMKDGYEIGEKIYNENPDKNSQHIDLVLQRKRNKLANEGEVVAPEVDKIIFDIRQGERIGEVKQQAGLMLTKRDLFLDGFFELDPREYEAILSDEFAKFGYKVNDTKTKLFSDNNPIIESDYKIGGAIKSMDVKFTESQTGFYYYGMYSETANKVKKLESTMNIEWSVYDKKLDKVVFTKAFTGFSRREEGNVSGVFYESLRDASIQLLNDEEFTSYLASGEGEASETNSNKESRVKRIKAPVASDYAALIDKVLPGVVTVSLGEESHGSGFLISEDGLVITNHHVVKGNEEVNIITSGKVTLPAEVVAIDHKYDLALLKVVGAGYKPLAIGNSTNAKLGSEVTAIGTPRYTELNQTVTKGIISGLREIEGKEYIQTDVSVSPGNSGGPLINDKGEVIGIVSWKIGGGAYEGLSFAIPIKTALDKLNVKVVE